VTLTKHRLMRAAYKGGCVIGSENFEFYHQYIENAGDAGAITAAADK